MWVANRTKIYPRDRSKKQEKFIGESRLKSANPFSPIGSDALKPEPFDLIPPPINFSAPPWAHVAQLYRRICLLRACGRADEAEKIQNVEFAAARFVAEQETLVEDPAILESRVQTLLDAEASRVTEAVLLAEMLAPLIADLIRPSLAIQPLATKQPANAYSPSQAVTRRPEPLRTPPATAPSIADLIDGMLGQDRPSRDHRSHNIPA
jgi:hypothetical protein